MKFILAVFFLAALLLLTGSISSEAGWARTDDNDKRLKKHGHHGHRGHHGHHGHHGHRGRHHGHHEEEHRGAKKRVRGGLRRHGRRQDKHHHFKATKKQGNNLVGSSWQQPWSSSTASSSVACPAGCGTCGSNSQCSDIDAWCSPGCAPTIGGGGSSSSSGGNNVACPALCGVCGSNGRCSSDASISCTPGCGSSSGGAGSGKQTCPNTKLCPYDPATSGCLPNNAGKFCADVGNGKCETIKCPFGFDTSADTRGSYNHCLPHFMNQPGTTPANRAMSVPTVFQSYPGRISNTLNLVCEAACHANPYPAGQAVYLSQLESSGYINRASIMDESETIQRCCVCNGKTMAFNTNAVNKCGFFEPYVAGCGLTYSR